MQTSQISDPEEYPFPAFLHYMVLHVRLVLTRPMLVGSQRDGPCYPYAKFHSNARFHAVVFPRMSTRRSRYIICG